MAVRATGKCERLDFRGKEKCCSNHEWLSCQVGQSRLFQTKWPNYRILKMNRSERSFTIERSQRLPVSYGSEIHFQTNFKDQFAICLTRGRPCRYSFAQDKWEELPPFEGDKWHAKACSLGDKVYVLEPMYEERTIHVLHNPDASFSSQDPPHWQRVVKQCNER